MHVILLVLLAVAVAQSVAARTELNQDKRLAKLQDLVAASSHVSGQAGGFLPCWATT